MIIIWGIFVQQVDGNNVQQVDGNILQQVDGNITQQVAGINQEQVDGNIPVHLLFLLLLCRLLVFEFVI